MRWLGLAALLLLTGCPPVPESCGSSGAERCNEKLNRVEYCAGNSRWLIRNDCSQVTPGEWICGTIDGHGLTCVQKPVLPPTP